MKNLAFCAAFRLVMAATSLSQSKKYFRKTSSNHCELKNLDILFYTFYKCLNNTCLMQIIRIFVLALMWNSKMHIYYLDYLIDDIPNLPEIYHHHQMYTAHRMVSVSWLPLNVSKNSSHRRICPSAG